MTAPIEHAALGFTHGEGIRLVRADGARFIDAASGTFNVPLGYDNEAVVAPVLDQLARVSHLGSSFSRTESARLVERLVALAPGGMTRGWLRDLTGSTANECAVRIAQKATQKSGVLSLFLSHHGQTLFTTAISGNAFRKESFPVATADVSLKVPAPYCHRCFYGATYPSCGLMCVERIHDFLEFGGNGRTACMIVEPILGNGGNIVPPPGYFEALKRVCDAHDILLVADEVQTGIGRTGHMFACDALGFEPAMVTLAKGLGGIGIPVAAVLMEARLDVLAPYEHSYTSGANPIALAAANATLDVLADGRLLGEVRENGRLLGALLAPLAERHACVGDVRGLGYMWGVEIETPDGAPDPDRTNAILAEAERRRLIVRSSRYGRGNVVKVRPPLVATPDDLVEIVDTLSAAIAATGEAAR
ncbi:aspartate aminotransferase family protein [Salinarimonas chemoclinalis]|uniref:aspartate aminotransferase family protein n=1 Tax=Salinarimonas chemoclinalis TaxID=3241599 RepID=UPI00355609F8